MAPHAEHARVEGNQRSTFTNVRPARCALYASMPTNVDHPASCTDRARRVRASPRRPDPPRRPLGSRGRSWWTAGATSPAACRPPGHGRGRPCGATLPVRRALLPAGEFLLRFPELRRGLPREPRGVELRPVRQHREVRQPQVDPHLVLHERAAAGRAPPRRRRRSTCPPRPRSPSPTTAPRAAPGPAHRHVPDPRQPQTARRGDPNRAALVKRIDCARSRVDLNRGAPSVRPSGCP